MPKSAVGTVTETPVTVEDRVCFVIMPISTPANLVDLYQGDTEHFAHVYDLIFAPAIERSGFVPVPPAAKGSDLIHAGIIRNLQEASIVLCDVSTLNANVFFELGIRTALNKPIVFVRDTTTAIVPFDTGIMNFHMYDARLRAWELEGQIAALARHITEVDERADGQNQLWRYFGLTQVAKPPPKVEESEFTATPVERKLDALYRLVETLRAERSRSSDPRRNPGVVLEDGFDTSEAPDHSDLSQALVEFVRLVDETAKRRRTQITLARFGNHLIVDFGKDVYLTADQDKIRMRGLLLQELGMTVEYTANV